MKNLFQESPVYQQIIQEGLEQGLEKGLQQGALQQLRQMLVHRVQKRFPVLVPFAQEQAAQIKDVEVLRNLIDTVIGAETMDEVRRSLEEDY